MTRWMSAVEFPILALWFGGGLAIGVIAAPAAFAALAPPDAAAVVGRMLTRWHYVALGAPLALLAIEWRSRRLARSIHVVLLAGALLAASAQIAADLAIRRMRVSSPVPISRLAPADPRRVAFGRAHGVSMTLMLLQVAAAGVLVGRGGSSSERLT